ncbi:DNA-binding protein [Mycetocola sp. 2940]|uniref:DNA-binding protein n=1 Tax=Mycetocola sp. 2940 TaxID=3156452 RepID=UPI0033948B33
MFVITADQVDSRNQPDRAASVLEDLNGPNGPTLLLPADRTAGDEVQILPASAEDTLAIVLELTREDAWSVGVGIGPARLPLPRATREATGEAFFAARDAVTRAKKSQTRFALSRAGDDTGDGLRGVDVEALISLLLVLRERRTDGGWELYDLLTTGLTQSESAERLGITAGAASLRARAAGIRVERASSEALVRLLDTVNRSADPAGSGSTGGARPS